VEKYKRIKWAIFLKKQTSYHQKPSGSTAKMIIWAKKITTILLEK
jgi:hypothetical protein